MHYFTNLEPRTTTAVEAMTALHPEHIRELLEAEAEVAVSLFMPTHSAGQERQQDEIRLKNMTEQATERLIEKGLRRPEAEEVIAPLARLPYEEEFWAHRNGAIACFASKSFHRVFHVPLRLKEELFVGERFHLTPLLKLLHSDARFFILAITQESARLFEATRDSIHELSLPPIAHAELDSNGQALQFHSHQAPTQGRGKRAEAVYHGHGGATDRQQADILSAKR